MHDDAVFVIVLLCYVIGAMIGTFLGLWVCNKQFRKEVWDDLRGVK